MSDFGLVAISHEIDVSCTIVLSDFHENHVAAIWPVDFDLVVGVQCESVATSEKSSHPQGGYACLL
jgi:hypothetical protein